MVRDGPKLKSQSNHQNALDADAQLKTLGWNKYFKDQVMSTDISETPPVSHYASSPKQAACCWRQYKSKKFRRYTTWLWGIGCY